MQYSTAKSLRPCSSGGSRNIIEPSLNSQKNSHESEGIAIIQSGHPRSDLSLASPRAFLRGDFREMWERESALSSPRSFGVSQIDSPPLSDSEDLEAEEAEYSMSSSPPQTLYDSFSRFEALSRPRSLYRPPRMVSARRVSRWLLRDERYRTWKLGQSSVLWICGKAGSGKTAVNTAIVEDLQISETEDVLALHIPNDTHDQVDDESVTFNTLRAQLMEKCPERLRNKIDDLIQKYFVGGRISNGDKLRELWKGILCMISNHQKNLYLILDKVTKETFSRNCILKEAIASCAESPRIKCAISSREVQPIALDAGETPQVINLEEHSVVRGNHSPDEFTKFTDPQQIQEFQQQLDKARPDKEEKAIIPKMSHDRPLQMEMSLDQLLVSLQSGSGDGIELMEHLISKSRSEHLETLFDFLLSSVSKGSLWVTKEVFSWLLAGHGRLRASTVIEMLNTKNHSLAEPITSKEVIAACERRIKSTCGWLVEIDNNGDIQFVDDAVRDFLLKSESIFQITTAEAHQNIFFTLLNYLSEADVQHDFQSNHEPRSGFARYCVENFLAHYHEVTSGGAPLTGFMFKFMNERTDAFMSWSRIYLSLIDPAVDYATKREPFSLCDILELDDLKALLHEMGKLPSEGQVWQSFNGTKVEEMKETSILLEMDGAARPGDNASFDLNEYCLFLESLECTEREIENHTPEPIVHSG